MSLKKSCHPRLLSVTSSFDTKPYSNGRKYFTTEVNNFLNFFLPTSFWAMILEKKAANFTPNLTSLFLFSRALSASSSKPGMKTTKLQQSLQVGHSNTQKISQFFNGSDTIFNELSRLGGKNNSLMYSGVNIGVRNREPFWKKSLPKDSNLNLRSSRTLPSFWKKRSVSFPLQLMRSNLSCYHRIILIENTR